MDKKIITDAFKAFLKQNLAGKVKAAQNTKYKDIKPLNGKFAKLNKPLKVANVAVKMTEALVAMDAVDALATKMHQLLPNTTDGLEWLHALPSKIANSTIGQIPVLGPIYRWINNAIAEGFARLSEFLGNESLAKEARKRKRVDPDEGFNAKFDENTHTLSGGRRDKEEGDEDMPKEKQNKMVNHPSFYENLDLHKSFSIPGAYTKTTVVNGSLATPKIAVHRLTENPVPDKSALVDRLNQKFSLIKAVRGLSATAYTLIDLANYERYAKINLLQYYVVKKIVQAAKTYSVVQTKIADNIIDSLGFDPAEVRTNLASYETLLCQWHRFITNNIPMAGTWIKRLEYLVGANVPDYSDPKVATIHMFSICMKDVFYRYDEDHTTDKFTFDCIPGAQSNSYSVMLSNFENLQNALVLNTHWQQLIADYFGAFGSKAMWSDKDYPAYAQPLNLRNADNDLCREQIKNAMVLNAKVEFITVTKGVSNLKMRVDVDDAEAFQYPDYDFGIEDFDITMLSAGNTLNYTNLLDSTSYLRLFSGDITATGLGSSNKILVPDCNGVGAQEINASEGGGVIIPANNHETIYTLHKDQYTEGEALEISQFKARSFAFLYGVYASANKVQAALYYKTQEYAVMDTYIYTFGSNSTNIVDQVYVLTNEAISDDDLQDTESPVDFPDEIMCWALVDWMPMIHFTIFGYTSATTTYSPRDMLLCDMDAFGSLDDRAFATSINYSIYSLQAASLVIDKGTKRISNLGDVYKDKPSRKG